MELTIPFGQSKFNNLVLTELVPKSRIKELLRCELQEEFENEHGFVANEYAQLRKYLKIVKHNRANVQYNHSKNDIKVGRVFANRRLSLQLFRKEVRHYLVHDTYDDLDIVNCYYALLYQLCQKNLDKAEYKLIEAYYKHREEHLKAIKCDRYKAKALYLMILHGGTVQSWRNKFNEPTTLVEVDNFAKEVKNIGKKIHNLNPHLKKKWWGQTISLVLQYYENLILEHVYDYLKQHKFPVDNFVLCFDGIMIPKNDKNGQNLLTDLTEYIQQKTSFLIHFAWKKMTRPSFQMKKISVSQVSIQSNDTMENISINTTDDTLAQLFKHFFGDLFIFVNNNFYFFDDTFWKLDNLNFIVSTFIANKLYEKLDTIISQRMSEKYTEELKKVKIRLLNIKNDTKINNVINRLKAYLYNKDIVLDNNPYILVFKNGAYDLKNFEFRKTKPSEYITDTLSTGYNYEPVNDILMVEFSKNYLEKVFINPSDDKKVFFKLISTCLLGKRLG